MKYILKDDIVLQSWTDLPYTYRVADGEGSYPCVVSKEEFEFLCSCDGKTEQEPSDMARHFHFFGVIRRCEGEESLQPWQRRSYENAFHMGVNWELTSRCNLNCIHCFNAVDNQRKTEQFTLEEACAFLDNAYSAGMQGFRLTGGEPMLHPDFFQIVREIYARHMQVFQIETNGWFITEENLELLKSYNPHINFRISFDGLGYHDWMRRCPGCEERTLNAIRLCKEKGFPVLVNVNVNAVNKDSIYDTILCLADIGVNAVRLLRTTEAPRWANNGQEVTLTFKEYFDFGIELASRYKDAGRQANLIIWQLGIFYPVSRSYRVSGVKRGFNPELSQCPFAHHVLVSVAASGELYPCHPSEGYYSARGMSMGNAKTENLTTLLNRRYGEFMTLGEALEKNDECRSCEHVKHCHGGCPALAILLNGSNTRPDLTKCLLFKDGYYDRLCQSMGDWRNLTPLEVSKT